MNELVGRQVRVVLSGDQLERKEFCGEVCCVDFSTKGIVVKQKNEDGSTSVFTLSHYRFIELVAPPRSTKG